MEEQFNAVVREVNFGIREGLPKGITVEEARCLWSKKHGVAVETVSDPAESEAEVLMRQRAFLGVLRSAAVSARPGSGSLPQQQEQEQQEERQHLQPVKVLCVSHGGFIRRFLSNFTDAVPVDSIPNCSITTLRIAYRKEEESSDWAPICRAMDVCVTDHLQPPALFSLGHELGDEVESSSSNDSSSLVEEYTWPIASYASTS